MKLKPQELDRVLRQRPEQWRAILIYGQDTGQVSETADAIARSVVDPPNDPFRVDDLAADTVIRDPGALIDAATAQSLIGGERLVRVRAAVDGLLPAFRTLAEADRIEAFVVVEAGDLAAGSKLRRFFEAGAELAAFACYRDEGRALAAFIRKTLEDLGVRVNNDAVAFLSERLGADRRQTRSELEKLALMVEHGRTIGIEEAASSIGDSGLLMLDDIAYAAADGDSHMLDRALNRAHASGESPVRILRITLGHFQRLHQAAVLVAGGDSVDFAMNGLRPPVFWKRKAQFQSQIRSWPVRRLEACLARLHEAERQCKTTGIPDRVLCAQMLIGICASRRGGGRRT